MKKLMVVLILFVSMLSASTIMENNMDQLMYGKANKTKYTKGQMFYYKMFVLPLLEASEKLYINNALELPEKLENLRSSWKIYVDVLSKSAGIVFGKGTVKSETEKNAFAKISDKALKTGAKLVVQDSFRSHLDALGFQKQNTEIIIKNMSPIIELIIVDLPMAKDNKERYGKLLAELVKQAPNAMLNMSAWVKGIQIETYYQSYINIISFLDEYYKCGANLDLLIERNNLSVRDKDRNNIKLIALKYISKDAKIFFNDTFFSIRSELLNIIPNNVKAAEKFTKLALVIELKQKEEIKYRNYLLREQIKQNAYDKIHTENKSYKTKVYNVSGLKYMVSFDYDAPNRIDKCITRSHFASGLNFAITKDFEIGGTPLFDIGLDNFVNENPDKLVTVKEALYYIDSYSTQLLDKINFDKQYDLFIINPKGKLKFKKRYKAAWNKFYESKNLDNYIKRQYIQMQGPAIGFMGDSTNSLQQCLTGYKAVDFLYRYDKTIWPLVLLYKERNSENK